MTEGATEAVSESAAAVVDLAKAALPEALTADGFDLDKVVELIDTSALDPLKKTMLISAVTQASENPELLQAALDQVKGALGF